MNKLLNYTMINKEYIKLNIDKREVLRYLGHNNSEIDNATDNIIEDCIDETLHVIETKYIYNIYDIEKKNDNIFIKGLNFGLESNDIFNHLRDCEKCAIMAVTLGIEVDRRINYYSKVDLEKSVILDACATTAIEALCDKVEEEIKGIANNVDYSISSRYSPGYGDFHIEAQSIVLKLLDTERHIGLTVTDSYILLPRKSVTAIIGIGERIEMKIIDCSSCKMYNNCMYVKKGDNCGYSKANKG